MPDVSTTTTLLVDDGKKAWLLGTAIFSHLPSIRHPRPTTSTKLNSLRVPSSPSGVPRGPRRTRAPSREAQAPLETTPCLRCSSSSSQSVSALSLALPFISIRFFFPYRRPTPSPLRFALFPLREGRGAGAKSSAERDAGTGESGESRLKGAFGVFSFLSSFSIRALLRAFNRHFFFFFSTSTSTTSPLSLFFPLFSHIKKQPRGGTARAPSPSARSGSTSARPSC